MSDKRVRKYLQVGTMECMLLCMGVALLVGIGFFTLGFWKTLLLVLLLLAGMFIGGVTNKREMVNDVSNKLFPGRAQQAARNQMLAEKVRKTVNNTDFEDEAEAYEEEAETAAETVAEAVHETAEKAKDAAEELGGAVSDKAQEVVQDAKEVVQDAKETVQSTAEDVQDFAQEAKEKVLDDAQEAKEAVTDKVEEIGEAVQDAAEDVRDKLNQE